MTIKECLPPVLAVVIFALVYTTACSRVDTKHGATQIINYAQSAIELKDTKKTASTLWQRNKHKFTKTTVVKVNAAMDRVNKLLSGSTKQKIINIAKYNEVLDQVLDAVVAIEEDDATLEEDEVAILKKIKTTVADLRSTTKKSLINIQGLMNR